ncbi:MAG: tetratricopeptide repeat protein [Candidatus Eisenbacteria bacterium]|nr:tetratricopeptide repeat protein [Candidatus Eisenbacteria bacterium]
MSKATRRRGAKPRSRKKPARDAAAGRRRAPAAPAEHGRREPPGDAPRISASGRAAELGGPQRALRLVLTALVLLGVVASQTGAAHLWGISHWAYVPLPWQILLPLLAVVCIWTPIGERVGRVLRAPIAGALFRRRWVAYGVLPLVGVALLWISRSRLHCYGDGWLLGELVARGAPFHGFDFVDYHLHARLLGWLGLSGEAQAFQLFAVMSTIAGGFYIAGSAWASRALTDDSGGRVLLFALLLFFAPVEMFMGYAECYSYLALFMMLFVVTLAAHYAGRVSATWPALAFGGGVTFHLDALFLAPLLVPILFWPPEHAAPDLRRRLAQVLLPILALFALAVAFLLLDGYTRALIELDFFKMRAGQRLLERWSGAHGLLDWRHWRDVLNLLLLFAPVAVAMLACGLPWRAIARRRRAVPRRIWIFAGGALWLTLLIALIHMKLGIARDWDLFAAPAVVYVLAGVLVWMQRSGGRIPARVVGMATVTSIVLTVPWFWINADAERALTRFEEAIADQPRFARAYAHEEIGKYFRKQAEAASDAQRKTELIERALAEYRHTVEIFPSNPRFHGVLGALLFNSGDHAAAFDVFQRVYEVDSTYALGLEMLALLHAEREQWRPALRYSRKLAGDPREKARSAAVHGLVAEQLGLHREAIDAYTRALTKDQNRPDLLERLAGLGMRTGDHALAERAFRAALRLQPTDSARVGLAAAIWSDLRERPEQWRTPEGRQRLQEALGAIEAVETAGRANQNVRQWGEEIREALEGG